MEKVQDLLEKLNRKKIPRHIAIIMDGNGRWAQQKGLPRIAGHRRGVEVVRKIVRFTGKNIPEVEVLTLYVFSTENWSRPESEVHFIMGLLKKYLIAEVPKLDRNNVRLRWIGRRSNLPENVIDSLDRAVRALEKNTGLVLNLAINYGGRAEIVDALKEMVKKVIAGELNPGEINEAKFEKFLYTDGLPPLDLLIRTGGDMRISNFLLWQIAYTEIYVTPVYWPDFTPRHFLEAILNYQKRQRRFGNIQ